MNLAKKVDMKNAPYMYMRWVAAMAAVPTEEMIQGATKWVRYIETFQSAVASMRQKEKLTKALLYR